jgi:hypothetical protein
LLKEVNYNQSIFILIGTGLNLSLAPRRSIYHVLFLTQRLVSDVEVRRLKDDSMLDNMQELEQHKPVES